MKDKKKIIIEDHTVLKKQKIKTNLFHTCSLKISNTDLMSIWGCYTDAMCLTYIYQHNYTMQQDPELKLQPYHKNLDKT